jgi:flagellar protein FlaG
MESQGVSQSVQTVAGSLASTSNQSLNTQASVSEIEQNKDNSAEAELSKVSGQNVETNKKVNLSTEELKKVAQQLQDFVSEMNKSLEFSVHKDSGRDVIKVIDRSSGDLVKQYPSEEVLDIVSKLAKATGTLVDYKV